MRSLSSKRITIGVAITLGAGLAIWFFGWAIWQSFRLWEITTNIEYQNALFVFMALCFVMGIGFTMKHRKVKLERPKKRQVQKQGQNIVDLGPLEARVKDLEDKLADVHSMIGFLTKAKKKEGAQE